VGDFAILVEIDDPNLVQLTKIQRNERMDRIDPIALTAS